MSSPRSIVVVGASLAGLRAAEALRAQGYDGRVTLVGAEAHLPYDRPPLSKEILRGEWQPDRIGLRRETYDALALDLLLARRAQSLDAAAKQLVLDGGERIGFDGLIIATGAAPRRLHERSMIAGVHVLRTLDDALALRDALSPGARVVVVGAGFIGLEVAASCRARGLAVTVVEPQPAPLASVLGLDMGRICARLHRDHGVDLRTGVAVESVQGAGRVERVRLGDGTSIEADVVVVGIGVVPVTQWLEGSGLRLENGVVCDEFCATSAAGVYAAGDVARWKHNLFGTHVRVEHWTNAAAQGAAAARNLLAGTAANPYAPVPEFWSDQYDVKIQFAGRTDPAAEVKIVHGDPAANRFLAVYGARGRLTGVLAFRRPALFARYSGLIARGATWEEASAPPNT